MVGDDLLKSLLERLRREPSLRAWLLAAPTGALATMGLALDDTEIVQLLDAAEEMDERPLPVTVRDVMTPDPITIQPGATVHEAALAMSEHRISGLPVCDGEGRLVGIVSEFDLIARSGRTVGEVMSRDVVSVPASATTDHVRELMVTRRLKRVPVLGEGGRLVGIVTRADLVRELAYRWSCRRCGYQVRSRRAPEGCPRCGAEDSFQPAGPLPALATCPTCGRPLAA